MNLIKLSTKQPISIAVAILFCFLSGIVAFKIVPVQMTPEVDDTVIAVTTHWENASPQEIESEVVDAQEEKLLHWLDPLSIYFMESISHYFLVELSLVYSPTSLE